MTVPKIALFALTLVAALLLYRFYGEMPETMASHFDGAGRANGFQSRDGFFLLSYALLLGNLVTFGAVGLVLRRVPPSWVSVPNRDYWLAEERREETVDFMSRQMDWFGVATVILLGVVLALACRANLEPDPRLDSTTMLWLLAGYFVYTALWLVRFVRHFRVPTA